MSLLFFSTSVISSLHINQFKSYNLKVHNNCTYHSNFTLLHCKIQREIPSFGRRIHPIFKTKSTSTFGLTARECVSSNSMLFREDRSIEYDWTDQQEAETEDPGSPWEGAVVYQRNPSISHVEYCTTLERLGLGELSTKVSRSRASAMGLSVTKAVKDFPIGTPVLISIDITRKKQKLRLDGIIRTVITLACNRCGKPTAECVFSNLTLVLTEDQIEEPHVINMGVIFGDEKLKTFGSSEDEDEDEASIDLDDWLYFPPEEKAIDISKPIRDMVHLEITINALCDAQCKGLCLKCGSNLNDSICNCAEKGTEDKVYGPLSGLRKQMQNY